VNHSSVGCPAFLSRQGHPKIARHFQRLAKQTIVIPTGAGAPATAQRRNLLFFDRSSEPILAGALNIWTEKKRIEKPRYIHRNRRG
jgi:hypothetical protein